MDEVSSNDILFMKEALKQAKKAFRTGEVPVGAVIVKDGAIISRGYNRKEKCLDPASHAEIGAIRRACKKLQNWRLCGCTIFVTLEPCMMCLGAILESRIERIVYGAKDFRMGFLNYFKEHNPPYAYDVEFTGGVIAEESSELMKRFFRERRS